MDGELEQQVKPGQVGYRMAEWARALGISVRMAYELKGQLRPRQIKLNTAVVVIESPAEYAARVAQLQSEKAAA
jgi:hypothetical protein